MKKVLAIASMAALLFACNSKQTPFDDAIKKYYTAELKGSKIDTIYFSVDTIRAYNVQENIILDSLIKYKDILADGGNEMMLRYNNCKNLYPSTIVGYECNSAALFTRENGMKQFGLQKIYFDSDKTLTQKKIFHPNIMNDDIIEEVPYTSSFITNIHIVKEIIKIY